jgi:hypothetical protein
VKYRVFVYQNGMQVGNFVAEGNSQRVVARTLKKAIRFNVVPFGCRWGLCTDKEPTQFCKH